MKERNCKNQKKSLVLCDCYLQGHQLSMSYQFGFRCLWYTSVTCTFTVSIVSTEDTRRSSSTSCTAWPLPVTLAQGWVEDHAHRESCLLHYVYTLTLFAFLWCVLHMWKTESQGFVFGFFFFFFTDSTHLAPSAARNLTWFSCNILLLKPQVNEKKFWNCNLKDDIIPSGGGLHALHVGLPRATIEILSRDVWIHCTCSIYKSVLSASLVSSSKSINFIIRIL